MYYTDVYKNCMIPEFSNFKERFNNNNFPFRFVAIYDNVNDCKKLNDK